MQKDFTLLQVGWFTRPSWAIPEAEVHAFYRALLHYLQDHQLTVRPVLERNEPLSDESKLMRSDITDKGFQLYQRAEQKWLKGIDKGKKPDDMSIFDRELAKLEAVENKT
jgi:hypothetical protein